MTGSSPLPPAGWYPDGVNPALQRWWDGTAWTEHTAPRYATSAGAPAWASGGASTPSLSFGEAIRSVFSRYADFSGIARRSEFWWWVLFVALVSLGTSVVDSIASFGALSTVWTLATVIPTLAVAARRLRDAGYSPLFLLLLLVPVAGIAVLVLACLPSLPVAAYRAPGAAHAPSASTVPAPAPDRS